MADRPILFSAPMVRALLAGTKTQTRRALRMPEGPIDAIFQQDGVWWTGDALTGEKDGDIPIRIKIGDRLWVREAFSYSWSVKDDTEARHLMPVWYWADDNPDRGDWSKPKPSIHMPRWASRLTLTVTDVRVQRLQDISEEDALAEGMDMATARAVLSPDEMHAFSYALMVTPHATGRIIFETIWEQINGAGSWAANPWVVAYTFTVERRNIDAEG